MAFMLSPGVNFTETDLTNVVPSVATSIGGFVGVFQWGPVGTVESVDFQGVLTKKFGKPNLDTATSFFSASNFLDYANQLKVVRVVGANARNAVSLFTGGVTSISVTSGGSYTTFPVITIAAPDEGIQATATAVCAMASAPVTAGGAGYAVGDTFTVGNATLTVATVDGSGAITGITVSVAGSFTSFTAAPISLVGGTGSGATVSPTYTITGATITNNGSGYSTANISVTGNGQLSAAVTTNTGGMLIKNRDVYENVYSNGQAHVGSFAAKYPGAMGNSIQVVMADKATFASWPYRDNFNNPPNVGETDNDELHILIIDKNGKFTGTKGAILEKYEYVSKAFDSRSSDGNNNYYKEVLNRSSEYVYWMDHPTNVGAGAAWGAPKDGTVFKNMTSHLDITLAGGVDDNTLDESILLQGWQLFADPEQVEVNLLFGGETSAITAKYIIQNIAETRRDCVAFVSPPRNICVANPNVLDDLIAWRGDVAFNVNSSYGALDSGWKYQYDQYNDVYRWVPLSADMAGLHARTDSTNDAWWAAGGLNRGQIKNVVKLSWNPGQMARDRLYQAGINPVTSFPAQGIVLFGNKTLLSKPSAFDRINVRRLFIVLEKAISRAARYFLFEFNDAFTRAQFVAMVEPYLRMIQGRRGITGFKVVCDETNNTPYIISTNQFVADLFIRPNYSAEFITLNFIASNNSAMFTEGG